MRGLFSVSAGAYKIINVSNSIDIGSSKNFEMATLSTKYGIPMNIIIDEIQHCFVVFVCNPNPVNLSNP